MKKNYDEIKTAAIRFFDGLGDLEQAIFTWANRKLKLDKTFVKTQGEFMDKWLISLNNGSVLWYPGIIFRE